jgi:hypothetical protein
VLRIRDVYPGSCFLSIPDSGYCFLSIPDPESNNSNKKGEEQSHKYPKIENYFIFEQVMKRNLSQLIKNCSNFTQKIVTKLSKIWVWDPGSGKNLFRIHGSKRHRIPDPDPQHWLEM